MSGPHPAVAAVRRALADDLADLPDDALVLVACSGGADSLALAAAAAFLSGGRHRTRGRRLRAGAIVIDHGWSAESAEVAARAVTVCTELGLAPIEAVAVDCAGRDGGPEAAARDARYGALQATAERLAAHAVLLGHTADDQAETVLLGLARGSGTRSVAGMAARRGLYRRPLLGVRRTTTLAACEALGLQPWHDPANADPAYARSRLRAVMPALVEALGPGLVEALARTADLAREDATALDQWAQQVLDAAVDPDLPGYRTTVLAAAPDAVRRRALLFALRRAGCPAGALSRRHVLAVDGLVTDWRGQGPVDLPGGIRALRDCGRLALA